MPKYKVDINLDNNQLKNVRIDNVATNPALAYPGKIIYNTTLKTLLYYDGTNWVNIYDNIFNSDGTLTSNRKMIMHGDTLSEYFSIRNNLDDADLFKVDGAGNVYLNKIVTNNSTNTGVIDLNNSGNDAIMIGTENNSYNGAQLYLETGFVELSDYSANSEMYLYASSGIDILNDTGGIRMNPTRTTLYQDTGVDNLKTGFYSFNFNATVFGQNHFVGFGYSESTDFNVFDWNIMTFNNKAGKGDRYIGSINKRPVFIATIDSVIREGINNSVGLGGTNLDVNKDNTTFVDYLNINRLETPLATTIIGVDADGNVVDAQNMVVSIGNSNFLQLTGGTITGDLTINGDFEVLGTLTTINTQTLQAQDNNIELNYGGTHLSALNGGITVKDGVATGVDSQWLINGDGNWYTNQSLGIGTDTFSTKFHIESSNVNANDTDGMSLSEYSKITFRGGAGQWIQGWSSRIRFGNGSTEWARFVGGDLGIGTGAPQEKLHIVGNQFIEEGTLSIQFPGQTGVNMLLSGNGSNTHNISGSNTLNLTYPYVNVPNSMSIATDVGNKFLSVGSSTPPVTTRFFVKGRTNTNLESAVVVHNSDNTDLFNILNNGNVGIGTSTPTEKLEVSGNIGWTFGSANVFMGIESSGNATLLTNAAAIKGAVNGSFLIKQTGSAANPQYSFTAPYTNVGIFRPIGLSALGFSTTGLERMRITQNGLVGIGTDTPTYKLDVNSTDTNFDAIKITSNNNSVIRIGSNLLYPTHLEIRKVNSQFTIATNGFFNIVRTGLNALSINVSDVIVGNSTLLTTIQGSDIFMDSNVGIGTATPTEKLEVSGDSSTAVIKVTSTDTTLAAYELENTEGRIILYTDAGGFYISDATNSKTPFIIGSNSNTRSIVIRPNLVRVNELNNGTDFQVEGDTDNNTFYVDASTDNVGIGTSTPAEKLEVVGNVKIQNNLLLGEQDLSTVNRILYTNNRYIEFNSPGLDLTNWFSNNIGFKHIFGFNGDTLFEMNSDSTLKIGLPGINQLSLALRATSTENQIESTRYSFNNNIKPLRIFAATPFATASQVLNGGDIILESSNGVNGGSNGDIIFKTNGAESARIKSGNVGIGTTTPAELLNISSNDNPTIQIDNTLTNRGAYLQTRAGFSILSTLGATTDLRFGINGTAEAILDSNGRFGIGTTTPSFKLDVSDTEGGLLARFKDSDSLNLGFTVAGDVNGAYIGNGGSSFKESIYFQDVTNAVRIFTNGSERMRINNVGNVGIGTTSPESSLHNVGEFRNDGTFRTGNPTEPGRWRFYDTSGFLMSFYNTSTDFDTWGLHWDTTLNTLSWKGNGNTRATIDLDNGDGYFEGNVGIGTTTPSDKLEVRGNILTTHTAGLTDAFRITHNSNDVFLSLYEQANQVDPIVQLRSDGGNNFIATGNFGIGTISPTSKLDVVGIIKGEAVYVDRTYEGGGVTNPFVKMGLHTFHGGTNSLILQKTGRDIRTTFDTQNGSIQILDNADATRLISFNLGPNSGDVVAYSELNYRIIQHNATNNNNGNYVSINNLGNTTGSRGNVLVAGDLTINDYITGSAVEAIKLKNDGGAHFVGTGNVGIGTTSPTEKLEVVGGILSVNSQGSTILNSTVASVDINRDGSSYIRNTGTGGALNFVVDPGGGFSNPQFRIEPSIVSVNSGVENIDFRVFGAIDTNLLRTDASTDRVGIGTGTPTEKLHIAGSEARIKVEDTSATLSAGIDFATSAVTWSIFANNIDGLSVRNINTGEIPILINGDAVRSIRLFSNQIRINDLQNNLDFRVMGQTDVNLLYADASSNNVGIGTNVPSEKLDVAGNIKTSGKIIKSIYATNPTGTVISFTEPEIYNSVSTPATGNITDDLTDAKIGITQKIYHNDTVAPTFPVNWVLMGNSTYIPNELNVIYTEYSEGTRVEYWILQEN